MEHIESQISSFLRTVIVGTRPVGTINCEAGEGVAGYSGLIKTGLLWRRKRDFSLLLSNADPEMGFSDLLRASREASRAQPHGPWYRCDIQIKGNEITYRYSWENAPFTSVKELELNKYGHVPSFVFERRYDKALVQEISDFDVNNGLLFYVPTRVKAGRHVTAPLLEVYATLEFQSDVNNGAMDQYFAREHDPMSGLPRSALYAAVHKGLLRIGHRDAAALFADAVAIFAHYYPHVEAARLRLGFPTVAKQGQTDIMKKYYRLERSLDPARVRYIREHIAELEQS